MLTIEATKWQYTHGVRNPEAIAPDNWFHDQFLLERPGNKDIQIRLFYDYGSNPGLYPQWQAYFRKHQPPTLVVWGKNDYIFPAEGAEPYKRDLNDIESLLIDTGHFALEEDGDLIANLIRDFLAEKLCGRGKVQPPPELTGTTERRPPVRQDGRRSQETDHEPSDQRHCLYAGCEDSSKATRFAKVL